MNLSKKLEGEMPYFKMGEYIVQLEVEIGNEYEEKAKNELRETPEVVKEAKEKLKELIKSKLNMSVPPDDDLLITFLRPCKYYPESALVKMKNSLKFRKKYDKLGENWFPSTVKEPFRQNLLSIFPKRDQHGRRILLVEAGGKWDTQKCSTLDIFKSVIIVTLVSLVEPRTQICGVIVIFDLSGLSMKHVLQITPSFAASVLHWVQDCIPFRLKAVHIVNQPMIFDIMFAIFKPFMAQKLRKRIHFHGTNWKSLHEHISPEYLPLKYEGQLDFSFDYGEKIHEMLSSYESEFVEFDRYGF